MSFHEGWTQHHQNPKSRCVRSKISQTTRHNTFCCCCCCWWWLLLFILDFFVDSWFLILDCGHRSFSRLFFWAPQQKHPNIYKQKPWFCFKLGRLEAVWQHLLSHRFPRSARLPATTMASPPARRYLSPTCQAFWAFQGFHRSPNSLEQMRKYKVLARRNDIMYYIIGRLINHI